MRLARVFSTFRRLGLGWTRELLDLAVSTKNAADLRAGLLNMQALTPLVDYCDHEQPIFLLEDLSEAVVSYTARAAEKLRKQHSVARALQVYLMTNPFKSTEPQYSNSVTVKLLHPTDDSFRLAEAAIYGLKRIYKPCYAYKKAGIMLVDLCPANQVPVDLFSQIDLPDTERSKVLMATLDEINAKMGRGTVRSAGEGLAKVWAMRSANKSPEYTTDWSQLPIAS